LLDRVDVFAFVIRDLSLVLLMFLLIDGCQFEKTFDGLRMIEDFPYPFELGLAF